MFSVLSSLVVTYFCKWSCRCSFSNFTPISLYMLKCSGARSLSLRYVYSSFDNSGLTVTMRFFSCFGHILHFISLWFKYFYCNIFGVKHLAMCCYDFIFSFWFQTSLKVIVTFIIIIITCYHFMQGFYNYVTGKPDISSV
jgi:hypothetical protein